MVKKCVPDHNLHHPQFNCPWPLSGNQFSVCWLKLLPPYWEEACAQQQDVYRLGWWLIILNLEWSSSCFLYKQVLMDPSLWFQIGHLPFLPSSNLQRDVLSGRHLDIGFEDILNTPEFCEVAGQPHAVVERSLGLLWNS